MVRVAEQMSANLMAGCSYSSSGDRVYTLKFVLVGSRGVGKTRLASLFHRKNGGGGCPSAVGMQFATRTLRYGDSLSVRAQAGLGGASCCRCMHPNHTNRDGSIP
ncbi:unnamed protein product [Ectocarpus fasciculatus]